MALSLPMLSQQTPVAGNFDGPAELPRAFVKSAMADTPAPGRKIKVKEGENLQEALDRASCGDTVELQAGATFRGLFKIPSKSCDDSHWIVVRTSAADADLPAEGTRLTPCYGGVEALPGRPPFHCSATRNVLARIVFPPKNASGPLAIQGGANHYRFTGLEITRDTGATVYNLVSLEKGDVADHLVFDRVWMHGTESDETNRGIMLTGTTDVAIVDSYFSDFKCVAMTGACVDSQAIAGGLGSHPGGPYKIVNNFLEAAGESIVFGGGPASSSPADIEIRHNYLYKPPNWRPGHPQFMGAPNGKPFIVKNLFELKNAQRVLFEGNLLENSWGGFSQTGFGIVLTPKNQGDNTCPQCQVTDVTIRFCRMSHVASGFQIGNGLSDAGAAPKAGERYSIHDVLVDDIQGEAARGFGALAQISTAGGRDGALAPPLRSLKMDHMTAMPPTYFLIIGGPVSGPKMADFSFTNSIVTAGEKEIGSTGGGPQKNCAATQARKGPSGILADCFSSYTFTNNAIIGGGSGWPRGNSFPKNVKALEFVRYNEKEPSDYRLSGKSSYRAAGNDSKDLGVDMDALENATRGVQ